jgi:RNAse (barnase) inhibitor barstar
MSALSSTLKLPDYFGGNWDALEECIRDLTWLPEGPVVLVHEDLPLRHDMPSLYLYLSILQDAAAKRNASGGRVLVVVFPANVEPEVKTVLAAEKPS